MKTKTMRVICAWCGVAIAEKPACDVPGDAVDGMCPNCLERQMPPGEVLSCR